MFVCNYHSQFLSATFRHNLISFTSNYKYRAHVKMFWTTSVIRADGRNGGDGIGISGGNPNIATANTTVNFGAPRKENLPNNIKLTDGFDFSSIINKDRAVFGWREEQELQSKGKAVWHFKTYVAETKRYMATERQRLVKLGQQFSSMDAQFREPIFNYQQLKGAGLWTGTLMMFHPEERKFTAVSRNKKDIESQLCLEALYFLREYSEYSNLRSFVLD